MKKLFSKKTLMVAATTMLAMGLLAGCGSEKSSNSGEKVYKVGIIQLVEHPALDASARGFEKGLASQGFEKGKNLKIDLQNAQADQSNLNTIAGRFISEKSDLIAAIATPAAQTMANQTKTIPIVGMAITDYVAAKLAKLNDKPGGNVTGVTDMLPPEKQLELITTIFPNIKTIGTIYSASEINSQIQVAAFKKAAEAKGIKLIEVTVSNVNDIQQAAKNLEHSGVEAVYLPTDNVVASAFANLIHMMTAAKIPVIPSDSEAEKFGALAMYSVNYEELGFQAGVMAANILNGKEKPADMPIQTAKKFNLVINTKQAELLGITIPQKLLDEAKK